MRLNIQSLIWFLVAFFVATPAYAPPVFGAVAAFASTAIGSIVVNAVIGIALSVGASLLSNLFTKKSESRDPGTTIQLRVGGNNPLMVPVGRTATAGVRVYYGTWASRDTISGFFTGTPNEFMVDVLAVSAVPVPGGMTGLWMNDQKVTVRTDLPKTEMGWPIQEYFKNGRHHAWVDFHDGTQTVPNAYLRSKFGNSESYPWTNDMIGRGIAYATITCRYDKDGLWQSGYPSVLIEVQSIPLYDPRKDSTVGGNGPHRWGQVNTYEPSNNAIVRAYNVARGIYYGNEWVFGGQNWPAHRLPASSWMAAMNAADVMVGGEPQFHGGGMVECDMEVATVLEELLRSSSALIAETGGQYKIRVGAPGAPVMAFDDSHIVVTREQGYEPFPGLEETYNTAIISYTEPGERWATKESPSRRDIAAIASDDGRELPFSVDLPWVLSNLTAQRIGKAALENGRRFRRHSMHHAPLFWLIEPLDVVAWTSQHNSYTAKEFDVEQISSSSSMIQSVVIRENDPNDYVWNPLVDPLPYEVIPISPDLVPAQVVTGWQVFPATIKDDQGRDRRPSIEVRFDGALTDIDRVLIQVRIAGNDALVFDSSVSYPREPITTARAILNGDFPGDTKCEVRGRFVPFTDRSTEWTGWLEVTTPDVKLGSLDVEFDEIAEEVTEYVADRMDWTIYNTREVIENARRNALQDTWGTIGAEMDRQSIRKELFSQIGNAQAAWTKEILVQTGPGSAIAQSVEELRAEVFDPVTGLPATAGALTALTTRVNTVGGGIEAMSQDLTDLTSEVFDPVTGLPATAGALSILSTDVSNLGGVVTAQGNAITSLNSSVGNISASGLFRVYTSAAPSGALARIALSVAASAGASPVTAAMFMDARSDGTSEIALVAGRVSIVTGTAGTATRYDLFTVQSGVAYISNARIIGLTASNIASDSIETRHLTVASVGTEKLQIDSVTKPMSSITITQGSVTSSMVARDPLNFTFSAGAVSGIMNLAYQINDASQFELAAAVNYGFGFTVINGVVLQGNSPSATFSISIPYFDATALVGPVTYRMQIRRISGSGTLTIVSSEQILLYHQR